MSERYLLASFEHESDLLEATKAVRKQGWTIVEAFTPYPVHGLDAALGLKPSRLTWVCFICGLFGAAAMLWFEHWTMAVDWPVNVGGKPWNSLPSDAPVAFEAAVFLAGFGSVLALFAVCRLYPGKKPTILCPRATNDRFLLVIDQAGAAFDFVDGRRFLDSLNARDDREHVDERKIS